MSLGRHCAFLEAFCRSWWVAGGWALDRHIAEGNRRHQDVDIAVLRRDQLELQRYLTGWSLGKVAGGKHLPWLPGEQLALPVHRIEAKQPRPVDREDFDRLDLQVVACFLSTALAVTIVNFPDVQ